MLGLRVLYGLHGCYTGRMENKMEITIQGLGFAV